MIEILRKRVVDHKRIERECVQLKSPAKKSAKGGDADVADVIRRTHALWKEGRPADAVDVARFGVEQQDKNGDLWCLYATALLKEEPSKAAEADTAFRKAADLLCTRSELVHGWIEAKESKQDWIGILDVADRFKVRRDPILGIAVAHAYVELGRLARQEADFRRATKHFKEAATLARQLTVSDNDDVPNVVQLHQILNSSLREFVSTTKVYAGQPGDQLEVWNAVAFAAKLGNRDGDVAAAGLSALHEWWSSVELRDKFDGKAVALLKGAIREIGETFIHGVARSTRLDADRTQKELGTKLYRYQEVHGQA